MTSLEAFNLLVSCLETEGALPLLDDEVKSLQRVVKRWFDQPENARRTARPSSAAAAVQLNRRERQILGLLNEGLSNAQIASRCFLTEGTVKWYLHGLFVKFAVGNRTALLHVVRASGIKVSSPAVARRPSGDGHHAWATHIAPG